jgi:sugar phosphate isomerase/epimerase
MDKDTATEKLGFSRRDMIKTGAMAAGAAALSGFAACKASEPKTAPPKPAVSESPTKNMHLSLAAYSMRDALGKGEMDLFGFIDWCAEMGLPGTELTSYYFKEGFDKSYLHQLKLHAFRLGVTVSGTAVGNNFCLPPGPEREEQIAHVKQWIDHAVEFSAPHIRIFAGRAPEGVELQTAIGWAVEGIKVCLDYAGERGVLLGLENHGGITARAKDHLAICDAVGEHPWFGVNLDTGNYRTNPYEELAMAAPRSVNVQIKVEVADQNGNSVPADLARFRDILVQAGYKGWVALEYEAKEDPLVAIPRYIKELQELFG